MYLLYSRKSVLGIGLMVPLAIIDMLKFKLYTGKMHKHGNTTNMIIAQGEMSHIEAS